MFDVVVPQYFSQHATENRRLIHDQQFVASSTADTEARWRLHLPLMERRYFRKHLVDFHD